MSDKIFLKRGNKADLPVLATGEPGFAIDTGEFFIGRSPGNEQIYAPYDKRSSFRAYQSLAHSITANNWTKGLFQTEVYDNKGEYDAANSKFVASSAGIYLVSSLVRFNSPADGNTFAAAIYKNGAIDTRLFFFNTGAAANLAAGGTSFVMLNPNDYIEIYLFTSTTQSTTVGSESSYFQIVKL